MVVEFDILEVKKTLRDARLDLTALAALKHDRIIQTDPQLGHRREVGREIDLTDELVLSDKHVHTLDNINKHFFPIVIKASWAREPPVVAVQCLLVSPEKCTQKVKFVEKNRYARQTPRRRSFCPEMSDWLYTEI
jgi:hypothetical protein